MLAILFAAASMASAPAGAESLVCSGIDEVLPIDTVSQEADGNDGTTVSWEYEDGVYSYTLVEGGESVIGYQYEDDEQEICPEEGEDLTCVFVAQATGTGGPAKGAKAQCMNGDTCTYKSPTPGGVGTGPAWYCKNNDPDGDGGGRWIYADDPPAGCGIVKGGTGPIPGQGWMNGQFCTI